MELNFTVDLFNRCLDKVLAEKDINTDLWKLIASNVYDVPYDEVTKKQRTEMKTQYFFKLFQKDSDTEIKRQSYVDRIELEKDHGKSI